MSATGGSASGGATGGDQGTGGDSPGGAGGANGGDIGGAGGDSPGGAGGAGGTNTAAPPDAASSQPDAASQATFLHVEGNRLLDGNGKAARFTGVNWFGFETSNQSPHGTWARDYRSMLKQMRDLGFNSLRLPWSNAIMRPDAKAVSVNSNGADPYDGTDPMNKALVGKTPLEMMDLVVAAAGEFGIKIILDNHSRESDGYMNEPLWYTAKTSEQQWIADWVTLVKRYQGNTAVVACDLDNEPFGAASWGTGSQTTDWNSAAERCGNAILAANPNVLIIVEGVSVVGTDVYWWGGNLSAVRTAPIHLSKPEKLVYSAHEYGPEVHDQTWFTDATFPKNLAAVWTQHFDFIMQQGIGHLLLGEFGIKDRAASAGKSGVWFDTLLKTVGSTYSWTFWCWNPNSGDTEGILQYDWLTPQQWKIDALKPYLAPMIGK
jgi:aryl-phospho-beta-D-glucosidase BglC (GH1 family)